MVKLLGFMISRDMLHVEFITQLWNRIITTNQRRSPLNVLKYTRNNNFGWVNRVKSIFQELDLDITSNSIYIYCCKLSKNY